MPYTINSNLRKFRDLIPEKLEAFLVKHSAPRFYGLSRAIMETATFYQIDPIYILAHAIHESNWGKSRIAADKKNLFGYGAVDKTPYDSAYTFPSLEFCVWFVMDRIQKNYLRTNGQFYGGEPTLAGMNKKYASDPNWGRAICDLMNQIEEVV